MFIESEQFQRPEGRYFFDTYSNLGQLFPYKFETLHGHFPRKATECGAHAIAFRAPSTTWS
jgi:hypothetical protein